MKKFLALLAAVGIFLNPAIAQAHDTVISSIPAYDEVVTEFPAEIVLNFSGVPKPNYNTVALTNLDTGKILFRGEPDLQGNQVKVKFPENFQPGEGKYQVGFQITSSDGHSVRGKTLFQVGEKTSSSSPSTETKAQEESKTVPAENKANFFTNYWWIVLAAGGILLLLLVFFLIRNRK